MSTHAELMKRLARISVLEDLAEEQYAGLGDLIRAARVEAGLPLYEASSRAGLSKGGLSHLERDGYRPSRESLVNIVQVITEGKR